MEKSGRVRWNVVVFLIGTMLLAGCGTAAPEKKDEFFTSGSREADQRAQQRMSKEQQLSGEGKVEEGKDSNGEGKKVVERKTLYERLGNEEGIVRIVEDFTPRVLQDPRVNWERRNVDTGGLFGKSREYMWRATPENVAVLKKHMVQFFSLAAGGPAKYEGKQMVNAHQGMKITNPEFDAVIGDMKATLDQLKVPDGEQKELLAIMESTRPQIVTQR